jgi:hypothetical protein
VAHSITCGIACCNVAFALEGHAHTHVPTAAAARVREELTDKANVTAVHTRANELVLSIFRFAEGVLT